MSQLLLFFSIFLIIIFFHQFFFPHKILHIRKLKKWKQNKTKQSITKQSITKQNRKIIIIIKIKIFKHGLREEFHAIYQHNFHENYKSNWIHTYFNLFILYFSINSFSYFSNFFDRRIPYNNLLLYYNISYCTILS